MAKAQRYRTKVDLISHTARREHVHKAVRAEAVDESAHGESEGRFVVVALLVGSFVVVALLVGSFVFRAVRLPERERELEWGQTGEMY